MVAHPDDCVIYAGGIIYHCPSVNWSICYLTYDMWQPRAREISKFWANRNIPTDFLGYVDDWHDIENKQCSFDTQKAFDDISAVVNRCDFVVTHGKDGEYGHPHHIFVNQSVSHPNRIEFDFSGRQSDIIISVPEGIYDLTELPLHMEVIVGLIKDGHVNKYQVCPESSDWFKENRIF